MELARNESIVCAYAQYASGPGWANSPIWVIIKSPIGYREECIQPEEQTEKMLWLYQTSAHVNQAMIGAVEEAIRK